MFANRPALNSRYAVAPEPTPGNGASPGSGVMADVYHLRDRVQAKLLSQSPGEVNLQHSAQMRQIIETLFAEVLGEENLIYTRADRNRLLNWIVSDITGCGPLEPLLQDESVTEVMCNGSKEVYVERAGLLEKTDVVFEDDEHLL